MRIKAKIKVMFLQAKGDQTLSKSHQELDEKRVTYSPSQPSEGINPPEPETINLFLVT